MDVRLFAIFILTATPTILGAQSDAQSLAEDTYGFPSLRTTIGSDGTWVVSVHEIEPASGLRSDLTSLLELLGDSSYRNEIMLDNHQHHLINDLQQTIIDEFIAIARQHNGKKVVDETGQILLDESGQNLLRTLSENLTIDIDLAMRKAEDEFQSLLSEQQLKLANQFFQRKRLQKIGALQYLLLPDISKALDLGGTQQRELKTKWKEILDGVVQLRIDRMTAAEPLHTSDAALVQRLVCTESLGQFDPGLGQFSISESTIFLIGRPSIEFLFENGVHSVHLPQPNMNQIHAGGSWETVDWFPSNLELLKSPRIRESLALDPDQAQRVHAMYYALESQIDQKVRNLNEDSRLSLPFGDQLVIQLQGDVEKLANEVDTNIFELLLPHQQAQLRNEITNLRLLHLGAEKYLAGGYLKNDLGISKLEEERIIGLLNRRRIDPIESERLNHEANLKLIKELKREQQRSLFEITGELSRSNETSRAAGKGASMATNKGVKNVGRITRPDRTPIKT